jgi:hypothetical protein
MNQRALQPAKRQELKNRDRQVYQTKLTQTIPTKGRIPQTQTRQPPLPHKEKPANQFAPKSQRKRPRIKMLAGFSAFIWSNLCTHHIPDKVTPRGHHDWPR